MRNRYGGDCYRCGKWCAPGEGHFERFLGRFRVQHATCAIENRGTPDPEKLRVMTHRAEQRANGTGKRANRARKFLKEHEATP